MCERRGACLTTNSKGQGELDWVVGNIQRLHHEGGPKGQEYARQLARALREGRLKGIAYSTPMTDVTRVIKAWKYEPEDHILTPRYHDPDLDWARSVKEFCERARAESRADLPESQIDWVLLASYTMDPAFLEYGLGEDLAAVRTHLTEASEALTRVFELRTTSLALPVIHVGGLPFRRAPDWIIR